MAFTRWRKQSIAAVAIALVISGCAEPKAPEKTWRQYFDDGKFLDIQEKHEEARTNYETAMAKLSGIEFEQDWKAELIARVARIDVLQGKLDQADKLTLQALALSDDKNLQGPNHGEVLVALDDLAESYSERATKFPNDKTRCLVIMLKLFKDPSSARQRDMRDDGARDLAVHFIIEGESAKAAPYEKFVIDEATEHKRWTPFRDIAAAYGYVGNQQKVDEYWELAKKALNKKNKDALVKCSYAIELAKLYRKNNRLDDAEKTLVDLLDSMKPEHRNSEMYEDLATVYGDQGKIEKAKENWRAAIIYDSKRTRKTKVLRKRLDSYARYLKQINQLDEAKIIQQQADNMREDDVAF